MGAMVSGNQAGAKHMSRRYMQTLPSAVTYTPVPVARMQQKGPHGAPCSYALNDQSARLSLPLVRQEDLDTAVLRTAFGGVVGRHGLALATAVDADA